MLKICFAGLGSIGQRHIRNIIKLLEREKKEYIIDAVRSGKKELPKEIKHYIRHEYTTISQAPKDYDIFFVTNPTIYHLETIRQAASHTKHMFIEKPVFAKPYKDLEELELKKEGVYYVACPLRYSSCFEYLKEIIDRESVFAVRSISSSYLPDWRKGTDYRKIYSADINMGGGVTLDLIHELDYVVDLFGMPEKSIHVAGKYSDLEINSDDIALYILEYKDKLAEIHLDYFGRNTVRKLELFCKEYIIECNFVEGVVRYIYSDHAETINIKRHDMYEKEMWTFLRMIEGSKKNINSLEYANTVLTLAVQK